MGAHYYRRFIMHSNFGALIRRRVDYSHHFDKFCFKQKEAERVVKAVKTSTRRLGRKLLPFCFQKKWLIDLCV